MKTRDKIKSRYKLGEKYEIKIKGRWFNVDLIDTLVAFAPKCEFRSKGCKGCSGRLLFSSYRETLCGYKLHNNEMTFKKYEGRLK
jgi:hypothetical protein